MITLLLNVLKFTILGIIIFLIISIGITIAFSILYCCIDIAVNKIWNYWGKKGNK